MGLGQKINSQATSLGQGRGAQYVLSKGLGPIQGNFCDAAMQQSNICNAAAANQAHREVLGMAHGNLAQLRQPLQGKSPKQHVAAHYDSPWA